MNTTTIEPTSEVVEQDQNQQLLEQYQSKIRTPRVNIKTETDQVKYVLYARKSSEDDERQALSIDSQIKEMLVFANKEWLEVAEIRRESHSAKASWTRPEFNKLVEDISTWVFNWILTWMPDRISRNAWDLWSIVDLMDSWNLKEIRTIGQAFTNSPSEKFLLMILCSQAKLENDNRAINVKRGLRAKCELWMRPWCVPLWYLLIRSQNFNESSVITIDEERAPFIKKMFEYVNNHWFSWRQVAEYVEEEWFRTKNWKKLSLSMIYRIFKETFYYWEFEYPRWSWNWYKWSHEPIITKEEFEKANKLLETYEKSKWWSKSFYYSRIFKCWHCNSWISWEERINRYKKRYVYYKCNKYWWSKVCRSKYIREEKLVECIAKIVDKIKWNSQSLEKKIQKEVTKFNNLQGIISRWEAKEISSIEYLAYILTNWTHLEKKQILSCIEDDLFLKDWEIQIWK